MKILITPAKEMKLENSQNYNNDLIFKNETIEIINSLKSYSKDELKKEFKLNDKIAEKSYKEWQTINHNKKSNAIFTFNGLMYRNMNLKELFPSQLNYIDNTVRIISPLYGLIKPFDGIALHRLDFSKNITLKSNIKLIDFWKEKISSYLLEEDSLFLNLLSDEFLKVLDKDVIKKSLFVKFMINRDNDLKIHSTTSKKGRGQLINYMSKNNVEDIEEVKSFNYDGFNFNKELSTANKLIFIKNN
ncbi:peroxide stress protein YaaA [Anaerosphaera multitolerans]|uniref:UPF0246 protein EF514_05775 n=1 Tax=Anaerosphaera multitolerans TaxID=2487351 RepID=A0A437S730_9FIRM|nr:peroxide stress protein YaaA [Anaerosphaera multitolerans]RVU54826.1 peroxide stress protein YaaA [Anaerosphaera multitolerans]